MAGLAAGASLDSKGGVMRGERLPQVADECSAGRLPSHRRFLPPDRTHCARLRLLAVCAAPPVSAAARVYAPRARWALEPRRRAAFRRRRTMNSPAYGLWLLVIINSAVFIIFAFSFTRPRTKRDWRSFGAFSAFVVALFTEMYGFPLTINLLSGWLSSSYPGVDLLSHNNGHLWEVLEHEIGAKRSKRSRGVAAMTGSDPQ